MAEVFGAFTPRALRDADLEECEGYLRRHPGRHCVTGVPCPICRSAQPCGCELEGMRSDRSHSNYNGAQLAGVEKRVREADPDR
jgi:hypothetical protein